MANRWNLEKWSKKVKERDGYICKNCGSTKRLHVHHIIPRRMNESLSLDLNNGLTLCASCHAKLEGFKKGHKHSKEVLEKIKLAKKGQVSPTKGIKLTEEHKRKLSEAKKGKPTWNKSKKSKLPDKKICKICNLEKKLNDFTPIPNNFYLNTCKMCRNAKLKIKRDQNARS